jgi:hypothetical protein
MQGKESKDPDQIKRFRANYGYLVSPKNITVTGLRETSHKEQARTS